MLLVNAQVEPMVEKEIAQRAYDYWEKRGRPAGSPEIDWYLALDDVRRELALRGNVVEIVTR